MLNCSFEEFVSPKDPLLNWRKKYWDRFQEIEWPKEAFQYIPLKQISFPHPAQNFELQELSKELSKNKKEYFDSTRQSKIDSERGAPFPEGKGDEEDRFGKVGVSLNTSSYSLIAPNSSNRLVFFDGFFSPEYSRLPENVVSLPLEEAMKSYAVFLQNRLARTLKDETDPLSILNGAFQGRGSFLYIPPEFEGEISLFHFNSTSQMASPRLMLFLGRNARLKIVQTFDTPHFTNAHFDAVIDDGAELIFRDEGAKKKGYLFQSVRVSLKRNSRFSGYFYSEGSSISRSSIKVQLLEENSEAVLQGLSRLEENLQTHVHALVEHVAPHTRSRQHFKTVLRDKSRSSFEGKIYVHPEAQKTEAYQLNNNLLLSDEAIAYAKPNLEIFADDVKASHGATVTQLGAEDLFYLRSRGISLEEAKNYLIEGFCKELVDCLPEGMR